MQVVQQVAQHLVYRPVVGEGPRLSDHMARRDRSVAGPYSLVGDSGFGKKPGPIAFTANNANDLHRTNIGTKRNKRWPQGQERIGRRSNVLSCVSNFGILSEQPESAVERFEHSVRDVEAEPLCDVVPDIVKVGLG